MTRMTLALLLFAALASGVLSRVAPVLEYATGAFLALAVAVMLERRARRGRTVVALSLSCAALCGGAGAALWGVSDAFAPFAMGAAMCAAAALLVALRYGGGRLFRALGTRAAFYGALALVVAVAAVAAAVALNVLAARHPVALDMTRARVHSLADETLTVLASLREPVDLHVFFRPDEEPARARVARLLRRYADASDRVRVSFHDPDESPAFTAQFGIRADGPRLVAVQGARAAKVSPRGAMLSMIDSREPSKIIHFKEFTESDLTTGILRATRARPRLCWVSGEPNEHAGLRQALADQNLTLGTARRPEDWKVCEALLISAHGATGAAAYASQIEGFVREGRGVWLMLGPGDDVAGFASLLAAAGIAARDHTIVETGGEGGSPLMIAATRFGSHAATTTLEGTRGLAVYFAGARPIDPVQPGAVVLASTSERAFATPAPAGATFAPGRDRRGPIPVAVAGALGKGRVVVVGDTDFVTDRMIRFPGNQVLAVGIAAFVSGDPRPVAVKPHRWEHGRLVWTDTRRRIVRIVTQAVMPGVAIFWAVYLWRTRRRR
jgi:hypothetical protein